MLQRFFNNNSIPVQQRFDGLSVFTRVVKDCKCKSMPCGKLLKAGMNLILLCLQKARAPVTSAKIH